VKRSARFEEEAEREYRAAALWYEEQRENLGIEFLDAVDLTLSHIVRFPHAGAPVPRVRADLPVRRAPVKGFPYHLVYFETPETIRVLAVAHDRRKPRYWKSRV
jgi:toxin ParE1/3/4